MRKLEVNIKTKREGVGNGKGNCLFPFAYPPNYIPTCSSLHFMIAFTLNLLDSEQSRKTRRLLETCGRVVRQFASSEIILTIYTIQHAMGYLQLTLVVNLKF